MDSASALGLVGSGGTNVDTGLVCSGGDAVDGCRLGPDAHSIQPRASSADATRAPRAIMEALCRRRDAGRFSSAHSRFKMTCMKGRRSGLVSSEDMMTESTLRGMVRRRWRMGTG